MPWSNSWRWCQGERYTLSKMALCTPIKLQQVRNIQRFNIISIPIYIQLILRNKVPFYLYTIFVIVAQTSNPYCLNSCKRIKYESLWRGKTILNIQENDLLRAAILVISFWASADICCCLLTDYIIRLL